MSAFNAGEYVAFDPRYNRGFGVLKVINPVPDDHGCILLEPLANTGEIVVALPEDLMSCIGPPTNTQAMRSFEGGATRNNDTGRIDPEAFLSPAVLASYCEYMNKNRKQADGTIRASDNWQNGIPQDVYMKSMWRHFMDVWKAERGIDTPEDQITNLNALLFNVQGMLYEKLQEQGVAGKRPSNDLQ